MNFVGGGKIALLGNSPLIALKNGRLFMAWGTPGGETIGQTQVQVFLNVVEFGMGMQDAVEAPRMSLTAKPDFYKPGAEITLTFEPRIPEATRQALTAKGNKIQVDRQPLRRHAGDPGEPGEQLPLGRGGPAPGRVRHRVLISTRPRQRRPHR